MLNVTEILCAKEIGENGQAAYCGPDRQVNHERDIANKNITAVTIASIACKT